MNDTTTPRTDAETSRCSEGLEIVYAPFARQLERELTEAKAEVERLKKVVEAARLIKHWHCRGEDGMVVSKASVFKLWEALTELDAIKQTLTPTQPQP